MVPFSRRKTLTYKGETLPFIEWAGRVGLSSDCIRRRIDNGWDVEGALFTPRDDSRINTPEVFQARVPGTLEQVPSRNWMTGL